MARPPLRSSDDTNIRDGEIRTRSRRRGRASDDKLHIPPEYKNPDLSYEWKRESVLGDDSDHSYLNQQFDNGWEPVDLKDMAFFGRADGSGCVRRDGLILCARPRELTYEARVEDYQIARDVVQQNNARMTGGNFGDMPNKGSNVKHRIADDMPKDHAVVKSAVDRFQLDD